MTGFRLLTVFIFLLLFTSVAAQENYIQNPDSPAKCENIRSGTFMALGTPEEDWFMVVENGIQTEYFNNGKGFVKAKQYFEKENPCIYHLVVIENSDPGNGIQKGDVFDNTILDTELHMIKLKSVNTDDVGIIVTLEKIKE